LISVAKKIKISKFIFTSSNSIFLGNKEAYIVHEEIPVPIDDYGKSKLESEKLLIDASGFDVNILRCPNIIDAGRVGMLSILFELIRRNSTLWVLDGGNIRHQCLYAQDLNSAIFALIKHKGSTLHNIGSDEVQTFSEIYNEIIKHTGSKSRVRSISSIIVIPFIKILSQLGLSPLGPYQFRMLTQNFEFDTSKIKNDLKWFPTKNNSEILIIAYFYFREHYQQIKNNKSANSSSVKMGILSILKYIKW
jgi:nucleoside-diphosphate-sugar epimerase